MPTTEPPLVAVVDDEPAICDSLEMLLRAAGYSVRTFLAAEAFLREPLPSFACAIVDLRLRGMSGLELQAELARRMSAPSTAALRPWAAGACGATSSAASSSSMARGRSRSS